jgi:hypothetical protein
MARQRYMLAENAPTNRDRAVCVAQVAILDRTLNKLLGDLV